MIQRIQSLYLVLTTLLPVLFLKGSILKFINNAGADFAINFRGMGQITGENEFELLSRMVPLSVVLILIPLVSCIALFLFKYRKVQIAITFTLIILSVLLIAVTAYYCISVIRGYDVSLVPGFKMFLPLLILIFALLAYRGIRKDEKLVRSYDRLR